MSICNDICDPIIIIMLKLLFLKLRGSTKNVRPFGDTKTPDPIEDPILMNTTLSWHFNNV
jgi:hypothetical protein